MLNYISVGLFTVSCIAISIFVIFRNKISLRHIFIGTCSSLLAMALAVYLILLDNMLAVQANNISYVQDGIFFITVIASAFMLVVTILIVVLLTSTASIPVKATVDTNIQDTIADEN